MLSEKKSTNELLICALKLKPMIFYYIPTLYDFSYYYYEESTAFN